MNLLAKLIILDFSPLNHDFIIVYDFLMKSSSMLLEQEVRSIVSIVSSSTLLPI